MNSQTQINKEENRLYSLNTIRIQIQTSSLKIKDSSHFFLLMISSPEFWLIFLFLLKQSESVCREKSGYEITSNISYSCIIMISALLLYIILKSASFFLFLYLYLLIIYNNNNNQSVFIDFHIQNKIIRTQHMRQTHGPHDPHTPNI